MRTSRKIWLIAAILLILSGCILFGGVMGMLGWDFKKLSTVKYETNFHEITEAYTGISLVTDTADVTFVLSEDGKTLTFGSDALTITDTEVMQALIKLV